MSDSDERTSYEEESKGGDGEDRSSPVSGDDLEQLDGAEGKEGGVNRKNLIVNYLPQSFSEQDLFSLFAGFGTIEKVKIMCDKKTGYSYGFGFVNFSKEYEADAAIKSLNGLELQNKRLKVSVARPPSDDIKDTNLYITNLPREITEERLEILFSPYGDIVQKNLLRDKHTGLPRGIAFVRYDKREQANIAIRSMNNFVPEGSSEPMKVRRAVDHGRQKAFYLAGFQAGYVMGDGRMPQRYSNQVYSQYKY